MCFDERISIQQSEHYFLNNAKICKMFASLPTPRNFIARNENILDKRKRFYSKIFYCHTILITMQIEIFICQCITIIG